jgi:hypothetical protein
MPRTKASHNVNAAHVPSVSFRVAKVSYFIYNNTIHSVAHCTSDIFKSAVLKLAPHWISHEEYGPVLSDMDDISMRWWLLCALSEDKRGMKLYRTLEDAEAALKRSFLAVVK